MTKPVQLVLWCWHCDAGSPIPEEGYAIAAWAKCCEKNLLAPVYVVKVRDNEGDEN